MYGAELTISSFWWLVPLIMMMICFLMMRRARGSLMCGFRSRMVDRYQSRGSATAKEILDRRYASGEMNRDEYEEIKKAIADSSDEPSTKGDKGVRP